MSGAEGLDFVIIGASKSGTTALFRYLRTDPDLYLPPDKDAPFFAVDEHWQGGWERFADDYFAQAPADALWGTATPRYMEDPRVARRIAEAMPHTRLIALLRNPIDRAFSQFRQQVRLGKEERPFAALVDAAIEVDGHIDDRILAPGRYARALGRFLDQFPADQLLVLFSEEMAAEPRKTIDAVRGFLGLTPGFVPPNLGTRYHVGGSRQRFPRLIGSVERIGPLRRLWRLLPRRQRASVRTWFFTQANVVAAPAPEIPPPLRRRLADHYRPDVQKLATMVGYMPPWPDFLAPDGNGTDG